MKKITIILLIILSLSALAQKKQQNTKTTLNIKADIIERTETTATFTFENPQKELIYFVISKTPTNLNDIDRDVLSLEKKIQISPKLELSSDVYLIVTSKQDKGDYTIEGLNPKTKYEFSIYRRIDQKKVEKIWNTDLYTLASEPTRQATSLAFSDATDNSFKITLNRGDGERRIIVVSKEGETNLPKDGVFYPANPNWGTKESKIGSGYVVYNGNDRLVDVVVKNLESGTYTIQAFEYNGDGQTANYLTTTANNNPRKFRTLLQAPKALEPSSIGAEGFVARWTKVNGATTYIIDIATDKDFNDRLELYTDLDVGDIDEIEIADLQSGKTYYFRVRASAPGNKSPYSNTQIIKTK